MLQSLLDVFLNAPCPLCDRAGQPIWCLDCQHQLQQCQLAQPIQHRGDGTLPIFAWGHYRDSLKQAIAALKYNRQPKLAGPLGHYLGSSWRSQQRSLLKPNYSNLVVVPIPMHAQKMQERGFNQAALLAESFCQVTRLPLRRDGLARVKVTTPQFGLSAKERDVNVSAAFAVNPALLALKNSRKPVSVLLLDDIYTTGSTVRSAAQTLKRQGIDVAGVVVLAIATMATPSTATRVDRTAKASAYQ